MTTRTGKRSNQSRAASLLANSAFLELHASMEDTCVEGLKAIKLDGSNETNLQALELVRELQTLDKQMRTLTLLSKQKTSE